MRRRRGRNRTLRWEFLSYNRSAAASTAAEDRRTILCAPTDDDEPATTSCQTSTWTERPSMKGTGARWRENLRWCMTFTHIWVCSEFLGDALGNSWDVCNTAKKILKVSKRRVDKPRERPRGQILNNISSAMSHLLLTSKYLRPARSTRPTHQHRIWAQHDYRTHRQWIEEVLKK